MVEVDIVATWVERQIEEHPEELHACWVQVEHGRKDYAGRLRHALAGRPVFVLVVEGARFDNPNAMLEDLVIVISKHRKPIEAQFQHLRATKIGLILVSNCGLCVPQLSSPVDLPDWFPVVGGKSVWTRIEDITWKADCPLNHNVLCRDELADLLFRLEEAILERIRLIANQDHRKTNGLLNLIRRRNEPPETLDEIIQSCLSSRTKVVNSSSFRPSVRSGNSIVARLWSLATQYGVETISGPTKALATALSLASELDTRYYESLVAAFGRPSSPDEDRPRRFARNMLLTILTSCQLLTAGAHADAYPRYPYALLRAVSFDLRRSLQDAIIAITSQE